MTTDRTESNHDAHAPVVISACIIARDEEQRLPDCLASVAFCDEVVVVDSGSVDRTVDIAREAGARVIEEPWRGFAAQRNIALDHARGQWVLEVDADERVTADLAREIRAFVSGDTAGVDLGGLPLREFLVGRGLERSAKYPKYRHRLIRRDAHRHDEARTVHEGIVAHGPVHPFTGDLDHLLAGTWREAWTDVWRYAELEAGQLHAPRSVGAVVRGAVLRPVVKFAYRMVVDGGWRDGLTGMGKIGLDCAGDSIVWLRHWLGYRGRTHGRSGVDPALHYGAWRFRVGKPRVVALAVGASSIAQADAWLARARDEGDDVTLISDTPTRSAEIRCRVLPGSGALSLIRALETEEQLRAIDAVIPFGPRATRLLRLVPGRLRGAVSAATPQISPSELRAQMLGAREVPGT